MVLYNIYHGLGGGFGGANYDYTDYFAAQENAEIAAYETAWEDYESYEGMHGLRDWETVARDYIEEECLNCDIDELSYQALEDIHEEYTDEVEGWLDYKVIPTLEDQQIDIDMINYRKV